MQNFNTHLSFISVDLIQFSPPLCSSFPSSSICLVFFFWQVQLFFFAVLKENKYFPREIMLATRRFLHFEIKNTICMLNSVLRFPSFIWILGQRSATGGQNMQFNCSTSLLQKLNNGGCSSRFSICFVPQMLTKGLNDSTTGLQQKKTNTPS